MEIQNNKYDCFSEIVGYTDIKKKLEVYIDVLKNSEKYLEVGASIPTGIIFFGYPGVGKTLMCKAFMNGLNRKQYIIRKNVGDNSFVDYLKKEVQDAIKNAPSVVLFDDIDKFANEDEMHCDASEYVCVQAMIDEARGKDVFFLATANSKGFLPFSLIRKGRFDETINIDLPSIKDATLIIEKVLSGMEHVDRIDYEEIAKLMDGGSVADLKSVINNARVQACFEGRNKVTMDDIVNKIIEDKYSSCESKSYSKESMETFAYHEASHAIISELLEEDSVSFVSTSGYSGEVAGVTALLKNDDYFYNIEYMENRILVLLAGKAGVETLLHHTDVGSVSDVNRAKSVATRFVIDYNYFGYSESDPSSPEVQKLVGAMIKIYYEKAKKLVSKNKNKITNLAQDLLKCNYILGKDLKKYLLIPEIA